MTERLRDDPAEWGGISAYEAARQAMRRIRQRLRERRAQQKLQVRTTAARPVLVALRAIREDDDWHLRIPALPDTRDPIAKLMGDPRPGRSALEIFYKETMQ